MVKWNNEVERTILIFKCLEYLERKATGFNPFIFKCSTAATSTILSGVG